MAVSARFGFDDILGNETVDFAVLQSNFDLADQNAAHLGLANVFTNLTTFQRGVATDVAAQARVNGDANPRFSVAADGLHRWGTGGAATDTTLYRVSAGVLRTDGTLQVGQALSVGAGTPAAPAHGFLSDPDTGFYSIANDQVGLSLGGVVRQSWFTGGVRYRSDSQIQWSATADPTAGPDVLLYRASAGLLRTDTAMYVGGYCDLRGEVRVGGAAANTMGALMVFPPAVGNKVVFADAGGGIGHGVGIQTSELVLYGTLIGFRRAGGVTDSRTGYFDTAAGAFTATFFNGTHQGNVQSGSLISNMHIQDGVVHDGWVRVATSNLGVYSNAVGNGIAFDGNGPYFYAGPNSGERFQSRARSDNVHRIAPQSAGATFDCVNFDSFDLATPGNYSLPDITPHYGKHFDVKNMSGGTCSLYSANGNGIYDGAFGVAWVNPLVIPAGGAATLEASAPYGGWIIL